MVISTEKKTKKGMVLLENPPGFFANFGVSDCQIFTMEIFEEIEMKIKIKIKMKTRNRS